MRRRNMDITKSILGGLAAGVIIGVSSAVLSDENARRRLGRDSRRAFRRANHLIDDFRDMF